jgi:hypothetical protein
MILRVTNHPDYDLPLAGHSNALLQAFFKEAVSHLESPYRGNPKTHYRHDAIINPPHRTGK